MRAQRRAQQYRGKKPEEARRIYESLLAEYARLPSQAPATPLGYYCAVGNLARIYSALGLKAETKAKLEEWKKAEKMGLAPWLPPSLKKEVDRLPER